MAHDIEIVRDEQQRRIETRLQRSQQIQNLRLHIHIERGDGFIANDQRRFGRQRSRNRHALTLSAG